MNRQWAGYINAGGGKFHYVGVGSGEKLLLCFHGYRNNAGLFLSFVSYLPKQYTLISIDLPHHGKTDWPEDKVLPTSVMLDIVAEVCNMQQVQHLSLMGYSMGGRICLKITELIPEKIDKVILIASDGLVFNPYYYFATRTKIGKGIFTRFLTDPRRYSNLIEWAKNKNIIDASRYKFAMQYIDSHSERTLLLKIWPVMSRFIPNIKRLKTTINKMRIPVCIFMGRHDRIIPAALAQQFQKGLETVKVFVLNKGHRVFDTDTIPQMMQCLED